MMIFCGVQCVKALCCCCLNMCSCCGGLSRDFQKQQQGYQHPPEMPSTTYSRGVYDQDTLAPSATPAQVFGRNPLYDAAHRQYGEKEEIAMEDLGYRQPEPIKAPQAATRAQENPFNSGVVRESVNLMDEPYQGYKPAEVQYQPAHYQQGNTYLGKDNLATNYLAANYLPTKYLPTKYLPTKYLPTQLAQDLTQMQPTGQYLNIESSYTAKPAVGDPSWNALAQTDPTKLAQNQGVGAPYPKQKAPYPLNDGYF